MVAWKQQNTVNRNSAQIEAVHHVQDVGEVVTLGVPIGDIS